MTPLSVVEGPEAWKAAQYQDLSKFMYVFSDTDIAELDRAIAAVQEQGLDIKVGLYTATRCNHSIFFLQLLCEMSRAACAQGRGFQVSARDAWAACQKNPGENKSSQNPVTPHA